MVKSRKSSDKRSGKAPARSTVKDAIGVLHTDMQNLMELQRAQEVRFVPEVKDVPRMRFKASQIHNTELSYQLTVGLNSASPTFGALAFQLSNAPAYSGYTTCFDQYRIIQVNVKMIPIGVSTMGGNALYTVLDYDDAAVPSAVSTYLGYSTLKITPSGVIDERTLSPRTAVAAYGGSTFNAYANASPKQWFDAASPGVQYYGVKYYTNTAAAATSLTFVVTMMVQFRSQRSA